MANSNRRSSAKRAPESKSSLPKLYLCLSKNEMLLSVQVTTGARFSPGERTRSRKYMDFRGIRVGTKRVWNWFRQSVLGRARLSAVPFGVWRNAGFSPEGRRGSKDDSLVAVEQNAVLDMPAHGAREH